MKKQNKQKQPKGYIVTLHLNPNLQPSSCTVRGDDPEKIVEVMAKIKKLWVGDDVRSVESDTSPPSGVSTKSSKPVSQGDPSKTSGQSKKLKAWVRDGFPTRSAWQRARKDLENMIKQKSENDKADQAKNSAVSQVIVGQTPRVVAQVSTEEERLLVAEKVVNALDRLSRKAISHESIFKIKAFREEIIKSALPPTGPLMQSSVPDLSTMSQLMENFSKRTDLSLADEIFMETCKDVATRRKLNLSGSTWYNKIKDNPLFDNLPQTTTKVPTGFYTGRYQ